MSSWLTSSEVADCVKAVNELVNELMVNELVNELRGRGLGSK